MVPEEWTIENFETYIKSRNSLDLSIQLDRPKTTELRFFKQNNQPVHFSFSCFDQPSNTNHTVNTNNNTNNTTNNNGTIKNNNLKNTSQITKTNPTPESSKPHLTNGSTFPQANQNKPAEQDDPSIFNPMTEHHWFCPWTTQWPSLLDHFRSITTQSPIKTKTKPEEIYSLLSRTFD